MDYKSAYNKCIKELSVLYDNRESISITDLIFSDILKITKAERILNNNKELSNEQFSNVETALARLLKSEPIQYITNKAYFFDFEFFVDENVLIPRNETEELVSLIINQKINNKDIKILDIGTGSGCIAVSLYKKLKNPEVFAIDISDKAIITAKKNAKKYNADINFNKCDILLDDLPYNENFFDVIVSNPPYIDMDEKLQLNKNVTDFEPEIALFVPNENPIIFYKKIIDISSKYLRNNGSLWFEINQKYYELLKSYLNENKINNFEFHTDFRKNIRFLSINFN